MKLYISGPITGRPEGNRAAFTRAARELSAAGHEVLNPHVVVESALRYGVPSWAECMWLDLAALCAFRPDGVVLLEGWQDSRGAQVEKHLLASLGCAVFVLAEGNLVEVPS